MMMSIVPPTAVPIKVGAFEGVELGVVKVLWLFGLELSKDVEEQIALWLPWRYMNGVAIEY
jgi:hypothetical protein